MVSQTSRKLPGITLPLHIEGLHRGIRLADAAKLHVSVLSPPKHGRPGM